MTCPLHLMMINKCFVQHMVKHLVVIDDETIGDQQMKNSTSVQMCNHIK
jgi:hypothetical protein